MLPLASGLVMQRVVDAAASTCMIPFQIAYVVFCEPLPSWLYSSSKSSCRWGNLAHAPADQMAAERC